MESHDYFGQLQHIFELRVAHAPDLRNTPETVLFAVIRQLHIKEVDLRMDIHYYRKEGPLNVVDLNTVQCIVGCIESKSLGQIGIVDCSGLLA